jgi:hypothetical protein
MTKPATKINGPWPASTPKPAKVIKHPTIKRDTWPGKNVDVDTLKIASDPLPAVRTPPVGKYDAFLDKLKVGQCVVCESHEAPRVKAAMDNYIRKKMLTGVVSKACSRYPTDGKGRVWLLEKV